MGIQPITVESAKAGLQRAVEEYGEHYVDHNDDEECRNLYPNGQRCIAALVLHYHGVPDSLLLEHNRRPVEVVIEEGKLRAEVEAVLLLLDAQSYQDMGWTWGKAVSKVLRNE